MQNAQEKIEDKIIDLINADANGRLIIFKPEKKDFMEDLIVERRGKYKEKKISLKINDLSVFSTGAEFSKDFLEEDFKADKSFYLLFACFDSIKQKISEYVWLIPSLEFKNLADIAETPDKKRIFRFQVRSNFKEQNKYSKFLVSANGLGKLLIDIFYQRGIL